MRDYLFEDKEIDLQFIETLKFDEKGLIPAVIQDVDTKEVLMVAYMNKESIKETLNASTVSNVLNTLKESVKAYYESN